MLAGQAAGLLRRGVLRRQQELKNSACCLHVAMPPCDFVPDKYESYPYEDMLKIRKQNVSPSLTPYYKKPLLLHQGRMQWLFDHEGRRYLDLFAGIATAGVGHCHPKVTAAAQKQLGRLWHTSSVYMHPAVQEYTKKLTSLLPDPLKVIYLTNSGSEANDLAMIMARLYTGSFDIISFRQCYQTFLEAPGVEADAEILQYKQFGNAAVPQEKAVDRVVAESRGSRADWFFRLSALARQRTVTSSSSKTRWPLVCQRKLLDFFAEPIQGVNGTVQYPMGFLKEAFEIVRERGGICISDEVQTGLGRTGSHFWGFEGHGVEPDIVTLAKGIGNGFPMAAVITTAEIAASVTQGLSFNTFGGNPMACVVGSAVLDAIEEDGLQKNCEAVGTHLLLEFAKLRDEFEIVGDVRGKGLMIGIEMVKDKDSRQPLPTEEVNEIFEDCKDMGVLLGKGGLHFQTFRIKPPMCITKEDADFAVEVFHTALARHKERMATAK